MYLAGKRFGARKFAGNFTDAELKAALRKVHRAGARAYVTVNTLLYDDELRDATEYLADIYSWGADAAIVQDLGFVELARRSVPIEMHASTQLGVHDSNGALAARELGLSRAILARELPISDIAEISKAIDSEVFVHGALCYAYSGQCLMSSFINGRSGNRGSCSQSCRMEYSLAGRTGGGSGRYLLSTRDLCTLKRLGEIIGAGVRAIKIEGRMRSPEYVALATAAYRRAIDTGEPPDADGTRMLALAFNREFTHGYGLGARHASLKNHAFQGNSGLLVGKVVAADGHWAKIMTCSEIVPSPGDGLGIGNDGGFVHAVEPAGPGTISVKTSFFPSVGDEVHITSSRNLEKAAASARTPRARPVNIRVEVACGSPLTMSARTEDVEVSLSGSEVTDARGKPLTEESVRAAVGGLGGSGFRTAEVEVALGDGCFVPVGAIKDLRRATVSALDEKLAASFLRQRPNVPTFEKPRPRTKAEPILVARTLDPNVASSLRDAGADIVLVDALYGLESLGLDFLDDIKVADWLVVELPRITTSAFFRLAGERLSSHEGAFMVHSLGAKRYLGGKAKYGGFSLNMANSASAAHLSKSFEAVEASPETSRDELSAIAHVIGTWVAVQGNQEVMVSEDCITAADGSCALCERGRFAVKDQKGFEFPVVQDADCRAHIFNSAETCLVDSVAELASIGVSGFVLNLQLRDGISALEMTRLYRKILKYVLDGGAVPKALVNEVREISGPRVTRGRYARRAA